METLIMPPPAEVVIPPFPEIPVVPPASEFPVYAINKGATGSIAVSGLTEISGLLLSVPPTNEDVWIRTQLIFQQTALGTGQLFAFLYEGPNTALVQRTSWVCPLPNDLTKKYGLLSGQYFVGPSSIWRHYHIRAQSDAAVQILTSAFNPCFMGAVV